MFNTRTRLAITLLPALGLPVALVCTGAVDDTAMATRQGDRTTGGGSLANTMGDAPRFDAEHRFVAGDLGPGDGFGSAISVEGDLAVIGAAEAGSGGAAYIFERDPSDVGKWIEVTKLTPSDDGGFFGDAVCISGDTVIVGARYNDEGGDQAGAAYIFQRDQGGPNAWGEVAKLIASDAAQGAYFGASVSISGDAAIVGAFYRNFFDGAAYIFHRDEGGANEWGEVVSISDEPFTTGLIGFSVSICGDIAMIGAPAYQLGAGSVYVYQRNGALWNEVARLTANDGESGAYFGESVSIDNGTALIAGGGTAIIFAQDAGDPTVWEEAVVLDTLAGAPLERGGRTSIHNDLALVGVHRHEEPSLVHVFWREQGGEGNWGELAQIAPSDPTNTGSFGHAVAIAEDSILVGSGAAHSFYASECGDAEIEGMEACDDGNTEDNDGCSATCQIEEGYLCLGEPSVCTMCGNGVIEGFERCDDGNENDGDGCSTACTFESGFQCGGEPTTCDAIFHPPLRFVAGDASYADHFGYAVALCGDVAVVGARWEENENCTSNGWTDCGAAYVLQRGVCDPQAWCETAKLTGHDSENRDYFGYVVAVSGSLAVVGAPGHCVNPDDTTCGTGAAYVFREDENVPGDWIEVTKFVATDASDGDIFGRGVSISGDTVVVGAYRDDDGGEDSGSAYVFQRDPNNADVWTQMAKLTASDARAGDFFGRSVSMDGDVVFVGAGAADTDCPMGEDCNSGSAYVYWRDEGGPDNWGQVAVLTAADAQADAYFGVSVSLDGDIVVIGASGASGTGGDDSGAAYVFERGPGGLADWVEVRKIRAADASEEMRFGLSVSVSNDSVIVGARRNEDFCMGDPGCYSGAAYLFLRDQGGPDQWGQTTKLFLSPASNFDHYGQSVAVSGDVAIVGAYGDSHAEPAAGAAYLYLRAGEFGDCDDDGDVDLGDFACYITCVTGPSGGAPGECATFDFDHDVDVDLIDWGAFQAVFTDDGL